jgi:hypothetical protein
MEDHPAKQEEAAGSSINEKQLTKDIIGPYSGIVYGRKGDKVNVINDSTEMVLVEQGSVRYHVRMENLVNVDQSVPLENDLPVGEDKKETVKPVQSKQYSRPSVKKSTPPPPQNNQSKLF